jgi:hypothetical protein
MNYRKTSETRHGLQECLLKEDEGTFPVPTKPHMPPKEAAFMRKRLARSRCFLEFGSGGSTLLAAQCGVREIYSVDTDIAFLKRVSAYVLSSYPDCALHAFPIDLGPTKRWENPLRKEYAALWPQFFTKPWDTLRRAGRKPDLILVDGRFRTACFLASLLSAAPGTTIIFGDYAKHRPYHTLEKVIRPVRTIGHLGVFKVPRRVNPGPTIAALLTAIQDPR